MKITTDMIGSETASVRQTRLKSVYDWYKGDGAYVAAGNLGVVRTAFNEYLVSDIANLESFASWLLKFNLLNSPDTLIRTQLFGSGAKGVWFDPNDLPTLTQDSAGTVPVTAAGQPVGRALDKSGNAAHATQAVAAKRPIYGVIPKSGRRNLLTKTNDFTLWGKLGLVGLSANGTLGGEPAFLLTDNDPAVFLGIAEPVVPIAQTTGLNTLTVRLKKEPSATSAAGIRLIIRPEASGAATGTVGCNVNPVTGSVVADGSWNYGGRATVVTDSGDYWQIAVTFTLPDGQAVTDIQIYPAYFSLDGLTSNVSLQGSATWAAPQLVAGAAKPYQRVVSAYDITETGVSSLPYLASDLIDDELPATVPSLGSNATVWFAVDGASTILTGQTVAAGPIATLRGARTYTMGAIDRQLTAGETSALTTYLDKARGAL